MLFQVDMDKLAENLQKLQEDDLLQVVQIIHDNKTQESYTKNDVESKHLSHRRLSAVLTQADRRRIPCGSLHPSRQACGDALDFLGREGQVIWLMLLPSRSVLQYA